MSGPRRRSASAVRRAQPARCGSARWASAVRAADSGVSTNCSRLWSPGGRADTYPPRTGNVQAGCAHGNSRLASGGRTQFAAGPGEHGQQPGVSRGAVTADEAIQGHLTITVRAAPAPPSSTRATAQGSSRSQPSTATGAPYSSVKRASTAARRRFALEALIGGKHNFRRPAPGTRSRACHPITPRCPSWSAELREWQALVVGRGLACGFRWSEGRGVGVRGGGPQRIGQHGNQRVELHVGR